MKKIFFITFMLFSLYSSALDCDHEYNLTGSYFGNVSLNSSGCNVFVIYRTAFPTICGISVDNSDCHKTFVYDPYTNTSIWDNGIFCNFRWEETCGFGDFSLRFSYHFTRQRYFDIACIRGVEVESPNY